MSASKDLGNGQKFKGERLALLSVTDKTGLVPFARGLSELGFKLLSTGGTAKLLSENGIPVHEVAEYTGSPEILDGRVKTLHPKVHGAILYDRANPKHQRQAQEADLGHIDLVIVNLYRFRAEAVAKGLSAEAAIEHIDIGGPTMLRAAAKNWQHTTAVIDPADYDEVLQALRNGGLQTARRQALAVKVFKTISAYDGEIAEYLGSGGDKTALPDSWTMSLEKVQSLRYGENPHQAAGLFAPVGEKHGFGALKLLQGKEVSYNNILDLDAATALAADLPDTAAVIVKHTNPCGVACGTDGLSAVFARALACDPKSAFGGIIATNKCVDKAAAEAMTAFFIECVAAPEYSPEALEVFSKKPQVRILVAPWTAGARSGQTPSWQVRSVRGGLLVQAEDGGNFDAKAWQAVTKKTPSEAQLRDLRFAMIVAKHVKSNAIVFVKDGATVGVGAGQMSRIDAAETAVKKAAAENLKIAGSVMASDAFFPFRDTVEFAAAHGVSAIVQPGGSKKDQDSIDAANVAGIAMVFTGERHFRH